MFIGPVSVALNKTLAESRCVKFVVLNNDPHFAYETFEKCSFSFEFKEGGKFNHKNTLSISRIKI